MSEKQIPHRPSARRGFVHPGLSYASGARNSSGKLPVRFRTEAKECGRSVYVRGWSLANEKKVTVRGGIRYSQSRRRSGWCRARRC
jgi:hypothetical protein